MRRKIIIPLLFLVLIGFSCLLFANRLNTPKTNTPALSIEEQYELLSDFMADEQNKVLFDNAITILSDDNGVLTVGISNIQDAKFRDEILSIPGIDSKIIRFVEFNAADDWAVYPYGFGTLPPSDDNYTGNETP